MPPWTAVAATCRSWYRPNARSVVLDRSLTIASLTPRRVAIRSGSSAMSHQLRLAEQRCQAAGTRQRLASAPGVGPITASAILASVGDGRQFRWHVTLLPGSD